MSAEDIVQALIEGGFQSQEMKEDLIQAFKDQTKTEILHQVLLEVGDNLEDHIEIVKDLANNQKIRQVFIPELHYWMIRLKLAEFFEIKLDDEDCVKAINEQIKNNINSLRELIKGVAKVLDQDLDEECINIVEQQLKKINHIFEELVIIEEGNSPKDDITNISKQHIKTSKQLFLKSIHTLESSFSHFNDLIEETLDTLNFGLQNPHPEHNKIFRFFLQQKIQKQQKILFLLQKDEKDKEEMRKLEE